MFKLTVVSGPNRGTSYAVSEGETSIGRQSGNVIVLDGGKISKKHCKLVSNGGAIELIDEGSANGTFINGKLTRKGYVQPGDRIGVGDYMLELTTTKQKKSSMPVALAPVIPFPSQPIAQLPQVPADLSGAPVPELDTPASAEEPKPQDFVGKMRWMFERRVMPFFYGLAERHEWRVVSVGLVVLMVGTNMVLTIQPILDATRETVLKELKSRADLIASQIRDRNLDAFQAQAESRVDVGTFGKEKNVRIAVITDLEGRIISPATRANDYLIYGREGFAIKAAGDRFRQGLEFAFYGPDGRGSPTTTIDDVVLAARPIRIFNSKTGGQVTVAMAISSIDGRLSLFDVGEIGTLYSDAMIAVGLVSIIFFLVLYQLTLEPFRQLHHSLDQALRGETQEVSRSFLFSEIDPLRDAINTAITRAQNSGESHGGFGSASGLQMEDVGRGMTAWADFMSQALVVLDSDRRVLQVSTRFEEITGIRSDSSYGQELSVVARDQAFSALCSEVFPRCIAGNPPVQEEFDFSGVNYKVFVLAVGGDMSGTKGYIMGLVGA